MTRVCLVRHGETAWNRAGRLQGRTDLPLTDEGLAAARAAAAGLRPGTWTRLLTSPLQRAAQTAACLADAAGTGPAQVEPGLVERGYGRGEGLTPRECRERWPAGVPGEEPRASAADRGLAVLDALHAGDPAGRVLAVTHGSLVKCVLLRLHPDAPPASFDVALLGATLLEREDGAAAWTVRAVGADLGTLA